MFAATPVIRRFGQDIQENANSIVRKPGVSSARKPLGPRDANQQSSTKKDPLQLKVPFSESKKPKPVEDPSWLMDICSYKQPEDDYSDIWPKWNSVDVDKIVQSAFRKIATPPPKQTFEIDSMFLDVHTKGPTFIEVESEILKPMKLEVSLPDFDDLDLSF